MILLEEEEKQYPQKDEEEHTVTTCCIARNILGVEGGLPGTEQLPWQTL